MLKSTSKPVKDVVRRYILDHINPDGYGIESFATPEEAVLWCYEIFKCEKSDEIRLDGERKAFKSWLRGLASALNLPFLYKVLAHDLVQAWLQQTEEEAQGYDEEESEWYAIELITHQFFLMVKLAQDGKKVI